MELVYLWVKNYKNIHEQGFNFSSRFNCDYIEKTNELTIEENDDYIPDFFGKNINVTAIVGKNGSGKSSVLEAINLFQIREDNPNNQKYFFILFLEKRLILISNFEQKIINNTLYNIRNDFTSNFSVVSLNLKKKFKNQLNINSSYLIKTLMANKELKKTNITSFFYSISKIELIEDENEKEFTLEQISYETHKIFDEDESGTIFLKDSTDVEQSRMMDYLNDFNIFLTVTRERINFNTTMELSIYLKILRHTNKKILFNFLYDIHVELEKDDNMQYDNIYDDFYVKKLNKYYLQLSKKNTSKSLWDIFKYMKIIEKKTFSLSTISEDEINTISAYGQFYNIEFYNEKGVAFSNLSSGEKEVFGQFLMLHRMLRKKNNCLVVFDEPDITLHPQWQKEYIFEFIKSFSIYQTKKIHFIVTTHSPFLLSDIPKQNIIFLNKENNGNCKVLSHDEVLSKKQTFGANIHTLLSDSFFMENGLMGEFAKGKINEIKKLYQLTQNKNVQERLEKVRIKELAQKAFNRRKKRLWQIRKIIGEPFLQRVIKNYLDDLELLFSDDKTLIIKELAEIEERKKELEALQKRKG